MIEQGIARGALPHVQAVVADVLEQAISNPGGREWTLQGFGMFRTYFANGSVRLHLWDPEKAVPGVSEMHTHPWDMASLIVAGNIYNTRFIEATGDEEDLPEWAVLTPMWRQSIRCGMGGGLEGDPEPVKVYAQPQECYVDGEIYHQLAHEIHVSRPLRGTITLVERNFGADTEHAYVYFDDEWVSAEPRVATNDEIAEIATWALEERFHFLDTARAVG